MQLSTTTVDPNTLHFNVGGDNFTFAKSTLSQPHIKDSLLGVAESGRWGDRTPFFDVNPILFRKWCVPYIRHGITPSAADMHSKFELNELIEIANSVGLFALSESVQSLALGKKVPEKGKKIIKIGYELNTNNLQICTFSFIKRVKDDPSWFCPDVSCGFKFKGANQYANKIFAHYLGEPHDGTINIVRMLDKNMEIGFIEFSVDENTLQPGQGLSV